MISGLHCILLNHLAYYYQMNYNASLMAVMTLDVMTLSVKQNIKGS